MGEKTHRLIGQFCLIRFADDALLVTRNERDAMRVMRALPKRFNRFGLQLNPDKTSVVVFKPNEKNKIDFLGFTHYWGRNRRGSWAIQRKTMKSRFARAVKAISVWCRMYRHKPISEQYDVLCRKIRGHFAYFGLSGNYDAIKRFQHVVKGVWIKWLKRRSQRHHLDWERANQLLRRYLLPVPRVITTPANVMS